MAAASQTLQSIAPLPLFLGGGRQAWLQRGEAASRHPWPTQLCRRVKCLPSLGRIQYVCTQQQKQPVITVHSTAGWSSEDRRELANFAHIDHSAVCPTSATETGLRSAVHSFHMLLVAGVRCNAVGAAPPRGPSDHHSGRQGLHAAVRLVPPSICKVKCMYEVHSLDPAPQKVTVLVVCRAMLRSCRWPNAGQCWPNSTSETWLQTLSRRAKAWHWMTNSLTAHSMPCSRSGLQRISGPTRCVAAAMMLRISTLASLTGLPAESTTRGSDLTLHVGPSAAQPTDVGGTVHKDGHHSGHAGHVLLRHILHDLQRPGTLHRHCASSVQPSRSQHSAGRLEPPALQ